jgi:hypothetical protein
MNTFTLGAAEVGMLRRCVGVQELPDSKQEGLKEAQRLIGGGHVTAMTGTGLVLTNTAWPMYLLLKHALSIRFSLHTCTGHALWEGDVW